ncbi:doublecortin domain-containing protein 1 [Tachyglossus aculeatus]|uniref:doublecortin domain-containing protein 1 n=1 Tax=Tachyglossus aculeatus TaxID=9261 RepID=UPI0018F30AB5|nr:doublecortin domain-containing protein 1 [Tachyglossus aculeatus]
MASKRKRPVSTPQGQLRGTELHLSHSKSKEFRRIKQQFSVTRVTAYKNGTRNISAKVTVPTVKLLLEECTEKLNLNMAARRVFLADGTEALEPKDIPHDADIYVSTGEPFLDPFKKIKDHLLLMKQVTWTMNGLRFPPDVKRGKTKPALSSHMKTLIEKPSFRILVFKNCTGQNGCEMTIGKDSLEKFLDACTVKMNLNSPAKYLYYLSGERIEDMNNVPLLDKCLQNSITPLRGPIWVSKGEGFSPSGAKMYIQGVLLSLHQRLKSAKNYCRQLDVFLDGEEEGITEKAILSMTTEDLYAAHTEVNTLIDELQTAIKSYKGHLSQLAPQLQAEQEQCGSCVYKHIKRVPANSMLPQGLQLKVYTNGKGTGEVLVFISKKELEQNNENQVGGLMKNFLHLIHQRLQRSSDFNPSGFNFTSARLFDEKGQEIKNPLLLKNEQKIWVSYGKDYRSPLNPVLSLTFDRVFGAEKGGVTVVYKTPLDSNPDQLPELDNWEVCKGFPVDFRGINQPIPERHEEVDVESHFLKNKADPRMVLYASVTIDKRIGRLPSKLTPNQTAPVTLWPKASSWLITKAGMILSRAMIQCCLAIGQPIRLKTDEGTSLEGFQLALQKRDKDNEGQKWRFGNEGCIYSKAHPGFVLTYLEELNVREEGTQRELHGDQGAWTTVHQETDCGSAGQVVNQSLVSPNLKQLSGPLDAHAVPEGPPRETTQLTVALVRKLEGKYPWVSAQRWAIKHEGTNKPDQWKHSRVENPLWNNLTYLWPVLPNGEINEDFDWPIQGMLIANSPPLKKPTGQKPDWSGPLRLRALRNGDKDKNQATVVIGPNISTKLKRRNVELEKELKTKENLKSIPDEDAKFETYKTEFQHFLNRCTAILNLPSAARRLFSEEGTEVFLLKDLQRDALVYVSCGEPWVNPHWSIVQRRKRLILDHLSTDLSAIRVFCSLRKVEVLVLDVYRDIVPGAKLVVRKPVEAFGEQMQSKDPTERLSEEIVEKTEGDAAEVLDSHARAHLRMKAIQAKLKYPWQKPSSLSGEHICYALQKEEKLLENPDKHNKSRHQLKHAKLQKVCQQQFEFRDGQIINCTATNLVLGVQSSDLHSGTQVVLVEKKSDDTRQQWIHKEDSRTFHLMCKPDLVLAVSMPSICSGIPRSETEIQGSPVVLQKYKQYCNGAANQKWGFMQNAKAMVAFHSTVLDKEITAANHAAICTASVVKNEAVDQPGFCIPVLGGKRRIMMCLACTRSRRRKKELKPLLPGSRFVCASGSRNRGRFSLGPFKFIHVAQADLSIQEAENTVLYYEKLLSSLRTEASLQTTSENILATASQKSVKIIAYRNGAGYQNGKLIVAETFPMLLKQCAVQLGLTRTACRLYTSDGTKVLSLRGLVSCAVNKFLKQRGSEGEVKDAVPDGTESVTITDKKQNDAVKIKSSPKSVILHSLNHVDDSLLTSILRNPTDVWVSCGEPFQPPDALQKSERLKKQNWLKKSRVLADLDVTKHKMRQLQGRGVAACDLACTISNSPLQPVSVKNRPAQTQEEKKLQEHIQHTEAHLSELHVFQEKGNSPISAQQRASKIKGLYSQPSTKRVWTYLNGGRPEEGVHTWGKTITELLDNCFVRLKMTSPAKALYTPAGERVQSWNDIERDMVLCVSSGNGFMSPEAKKQQVNIRATYARIRKQQGPDATDIVVTPTEERKFQTNDSNSFLALGPSHQPSN